LPAASAAIAGSEPTFDEPPAGAESAVDLGGTNYDSTFLTNFLADGADDFDDDELDDDDEGLPEDGRGGGGGGGDGSDGSEHDVHDVD
jgi:hypothetical protein